MFLMIGLKFLYVLSVGLVRRIGDFVVPNLVLIEMYMFR
jgi:hypothetical protein